MYTEARRLLISMQPAVVEVSLPSRGDLHTYKLFSHPTKCLISRCWRVHFKYMWRPPSAVPCSRHSRYSEGACELAAFDTRVPDAKVASRAAGAALEDMPLEGSIVSWLQNSELHCSDSWRRGRTVNWCKRGTSNVRGLGGRALRREQVQPLQRRKRRP